MWTSNAQNRKVDIDHRPADANPSTELWGQRETEVETRGSMRMMEPLVTLWPCWGWMGFCIIVWKVGLLMLDNCAVVTGTADGTSVVGLLTFSGAGFFAYVEDHASCSVPVVPARLIKFYSFIFHSSAVSSSTSAITLLDSVWLTAPWEPKLWADHLLFWCRRPEQSCCNAHTLGGCFCWPHSGCGRETYVELVLGSDSHPLLFYMATAWEGGCGIIGVKAWFKFQILF